MPAVVMVAKEQVRVKTGAELSATASATAGPASQVKLDRAAALLRLGGEQAQLEASDAANASRLNLDKGAVLKGNALLTTAGSTQLDSTLALNKGGALNMQGANIQLGGVNPNNTPGAQPAVASTGTAATNTGATNTAATATVSSATASEPAAPSSPWLYFADDFFTNLGLADVSLTAAQKLRLADGVNQRIGVTSAR